MITSSTKSKSPNAKYQLRLRDAKRAVILNAARRVFLKHGYADATTEMIRMESGVSKATVYAHFPTKKVLFEAVCHMRSEDFGKSLQSAVNPDDEPREFLARFGTAFLQYLWSAEGLSFYRLMIAGARRFPELGKMIYRTGMTMIASELVASYLSKADARRWLRVQDPAAAADHFLSMLRGETYNRALLRVGKVPKNAELSKYVAMKVKFFLVAYLPKAPRTRSAPG